MARKYYDVGAKPLDKNDGEERIKVVEPTPNTTSMRVSRGMVHNMLAGYKHDIKAGTQLTIFDELEAKTQEKVRELKVDKSELYLGIDMDGDGWEIVEVLQKLLFTHSNTTDQSKADYYKGDTDPEHKVTIWNNQKQPMGYIETTLAELTRERVGKAKPAGSDFKKTEAMLNKYNMQRFLIRYKEHYVETMKNGKTRPGSRTVTDYIFLYKATVTRDDAAKTSLVKIWLTPAFFQQIATNYDLKPADYLERVRTAYTELSGNTRAQLPNYLLVFIAQLMDAQHYEDMTYHCKLLGTEKEKGLYDRINHSWVKVRRWKDLENTLAMYVEIAKRIGLLEEHWITKSEITGDDIAYFKVVALGEWV